MGSTDMREQIRRRLDAVTSERRAEDDAEDGDLAASVTQPGWLDAEADEPNPRARVALGRRGVVALASVALVAACIGGVAVWRDRPVPQAVAPLPVTSIADEVPLPVDAPAPAPAAPEIVVSVVGLVHTGGLVRLPDGARVADALAAAGGAREGADLLGLNLAQKLADGDQVLVGLAPTPGTAPVVGSATVGAGVADAAAGGPVNLNTATEAQLDELPGVGPVTATAIIAWRTENGPFTDVEQLGEVTGIGPARLDKLRDVVTVR